MSEEAESRPPVARKPTFRATFAHRDFAALWSGQSVSAIGNHLFPVALATFVLGHGMTISQLGEVMAALALAIVLGTAAATAVGDRWRRVRLMLAADAVRMTAVLCLALLRGNAPFVAIVGLTLAMGFAEGLFQPAFAAVMPRVIPAELLQPANGLTAFGQYFAAVAGPAAAGAMASIWSPNTALFVDAATFPLSLLTLLLIREVGPTRTEETGASRPGVSSGLRQARTDFGEGFRAVVARPWLWSTIAMCGAVMTLALAPALVLMPVVARERLGGNGAYGATLAAAGAGAVLASLLAGRIKPSRPGLVAVCGILCVAPSMAGLALFSLTGVVLTQVLAGAGVTIFQVLFITAIQRDVPDHLLGRVMALDWLGSTALMPIGYALTGPLVGAVGARSLLISASTLTAAVALMPMLAPGGTVFSSRDLSPVLTGKG